MTEVILKVADEKKLAELPILGKKPKSDKEEKFLREMVEYEFYNLEQPGLALRFAYGTTNKHHTFTFFHGGKYQIPRFLAQHIESKGTPIWDWRPNGLGGLEKKLTGKNPRFRMSQVFN